MIDNDRKLLWGEGGVTMTLLKECGDAARLSWVKKGGLLKRLSGYKRPSEPVHHSVHSPCAV